MVIEVGKSAPPFTLPDQTGAAVALADFRGQDVVVYFYPRDDTPGCTKEACGFRDAWAELRQRGVVVLGVSPDQPAAHEKFRAKYRLPFTLLADPEKRTLAAYGAWGEKVLYGKKTTGVIRSTVWVGPDGKVKRHWPKVAKAEAHPAEVLAALRAG
jgi:thioredoxin-dependent peroxiredoxin